MHCALLRQQECQPGRMGDGVDGEFGAGVGFCLLPRALPWAGMLCPFRAGMFNLEVGVL